MEYFGNKVLLGNVLTLKYLYDNFFNRCHWYDGCFLNRTIGNFLEE